ncbi:MAG: GH3 auxin-responsive promoter family protein, partial [Muribaculaceae bacterium]|nr:GH3 auxin-responsive promoter family protein [Muribaculaceae bacterium]
PCIVLNPICDEMLNYTPIVRPYFRHIDRQMLRAAADVGASQAATLRSLLAQGCETVWGREHGYRRDMTYDEWRAASSTIEYEDIRPYVMRMVDGERSVLWPGVTRRFAQSSGTSGGKSKYIPVTDRGLQRVHYRGGTDSVARYLSLYPDSRLMSGKALILGGSFATELHPGDSRVEVGDLSAHLIENINPLAGLVRVPERRVALMSNWNEKLPRLVESVVKEDITNLSGVPSWMMTVLKEVLRTTGASTIHEVWPHLEVFFHGGISFEPYRAEYSRLVGDNHMRYFETYNASEGFFGVQYERGNRAMLLLMDADTFYEFIPACGGDPVPATDVERGKVYELVITNSNGLWRYRLGDTVRIESTSPLTITVAGRTQHYINAFGEELMVYNADAAVAKACAAMGASIANYTAAPVYATCGTRGRHEWLVEWINRPSDVDEFARVLDNALRQENSDYDAKRKGDIFLSPLTIVSVPRGTFDRWLQTTGKLGGQRKIPRLCPDRRYVDAILKQSEQ